MCKYLLHNFFWKTQKAGWFNEAKRSKTGNSLGGQKNAKPTNEDLGQTSNWSKLIAAYLPVARLTILDRLVLLLRVPRHKGQEITKQDEHWPNMRQNSSPLLTRKATARPRNEMLCL